MIIVFRIRARIYYLPHKLFFPYGSAMDSQCRTPPRHREKVGITLGENK